MFLYIELKCNLQMSCIVFSSLVRSLRVSLTGLSISLPWQIVPALICIRSDSIIVNYSANGT